MLPSVLAVLHPSSQFSTHSPSPPPILAAHRTHPHFGGLFLLSVTPFKILPPAETWKVLPDSCSKEVSCGRCGSMTLGHRQGSSEQEGLQNRQARNIKVLGSLKELYSLRLKGCVRVDWRTRHLGNGGLGSHVNTQGRA